MWDGAMGPKSVKPRIDEILAVVADFHHITRDEIKSKCRKREYAWPRQQATMLAREMTDHSYPLLARLFGGFDHSTLVHSVQKIAAQTAWDEKLAADLNECRARIIALASARAERQGASSEWTPPPPLRICKPDAVTVSYDLQSWRALAGEIAA